MAKLTFELDFTAEASVVTAADKLAAIRRYVGEGHCDRATLLALCDGEPSEMKLWAEPATDGTTEHTEITES